MDLGDKQSPSEPSKSPQKRIFGTSVASTHIEEKNRKMKKLLLAVFVSTIFSVQTVPSQAAPVINTFCLTVPNDAGQVFSAPSGGKCKSPAKFINLGTTGIIEMLNLVAKAN